MASVSPAHFDCTPHHFSSILLAPDTVGTYNIKVISQQKIKGSASSIHHHVVLIHSHQTDSKINRAAFLKTYRQIDLICQAAKHIGSKKAKGAFHLSELTGQTIPVAMIISLLIKTLQSDHSDLK